MNKPDLSQDRELVALVKAIWEPWHEKWAIPTTKPQRFEDIDKHSLREWCWIMDAARTHLCSGYTLPEANDANAARLASELLVIHGNGAPGKPTWTAWVREAKDYLQALHAAFGEPEKPAPDYTTTDEVADALRAEEEEADSITGCDPTDCDICQAEEERRAAERRAKSQEKPVREPVPALYVALASNSKMMEVLMECLEEESHRVMRIRYWASIFEEASCKS